VSIHEPKIPSRGSQYWLQKLVNENPSVLNDAIHRASCGAIPSAIDWKSPLSKDNNVEYRDRDFLKVLGLSDFVGALTDCWPLHGPQWDGLGISANSDYILVEAKANIQEFISPPTDATGKSLNKIIATLNETKQYFKMGKDLCWHNYFYQFTNRLAHYYFMRIKCHKKAVLVFVNFIGDRTHSIPGPLTIDEWKVAYTCASKILGIRRFRKSDNIFNVYIDVSRKPMYELFARGN